MENFNVFFTTKILQLVYPPLWQGPFSENPYTKLRLGRSKVAAAFLADAADDAAAIAWCLCVPLLFAGPTSAARPMSDLANG